MAKLLRVPKGPLLTLSEEEVKRLGLKEKHEYDFEKSGQEWVLKERPNPMDERILTILRGRELKDRVEGVFEKVLNREEFARFQELLKEKKILKYKGGEQYKKAVYKLPEELEQKAEAKKEAPKKPAEKKEADSEDPFSFFEKNGFAIIRDDAMAKQFSDFYREAIQAREIMGLKEFDGNYLVVAEEMYNQTAPKVLEYLAQHEQASLQELGEYCKKEKALVKGVCALLRENGNLIEKRSELYRMVK
ncbi:MAG: hypothetical protein V1847_04215 [Candidatus Diapherotrites archaeon]